MNYDKLLKDPRWRLKRRVILKRDNYTCVKCGSKETLCAHHTYYYKKPTNPWEYPDDCLITLCETCHNNWHKHNESIYLDNPDAKIPKPKKKLKRKKKQYKGKFKNKRKHESYTNKTPGICWAEIQAHRENFVQLKDGTWYRKGSVPKK